MSNERRSNAIFRPIPSTWYETQRITFFKLGKHRYSNSSPKTISHSIRRGTNYNKKPSTASSSNLPARGTTPSNSWSAMASTMTWWRTWKATWSSSPNQRNMHRSWKTSWPSRRLRTSGYSWWRTGRRRGGCGPGRENPWSSGLLLSLCKA